MSLLGSQVHEAQALAFIRRAGDAQALGGPIHPLPGVRQRHPILGISHAPIGGQAIQPQGFGRIMGFARALRIVSPGFDRRLWWVRWARCLGSLPAGGPRGAPGVDVWRVVIFDTGGFYPTVGETPRAQYLNARAVQEAFNLPSRDWLRQRYQAAGLPDGPARKAVLKKLTKQRRKAAFTAAEGRINWVEIFGYNEDWLFGTPAGTLHRPGYRRLASLESDVAAELSLRHRRNASSEPIPFDASAGLDNVRRPRSQVELDAYEDLIFRTGKAETEAIFRVRDTESVTAVSR